jgi:hypothetical protein
MTQAVSQAQLTNEERALHDAFRNWVMTSEA